jgi:hypothetical protein
MDSPDLSFGMGSRSHRPVKALPGDYFLPNETDYGD